MKNATANINLMIRLLDWLNTGIKKVRGKLSAGDRQVRSTIANYNEEIVFKMESSLFNFLLQIFKLPFFSRVVKPYWSCTLIFLEIEFLQ